ncbi:GGDEF domain-containing protein [Longispora albida]|uniref:GGDEF domain-containing protein n=1 Tax=Longispora albida TaxID=203523 RepID=UPI00036764DF|nr:GGDEF domain-containing protein [Longispora albida]
MSEAPPSPHDRAAVYRYLQALVVGGSYDRAYAEAERIAEESKDPHAALQAMTYQAIAAANTRRLDDCVRILSRAFTAVDAHWDPALAGELHVLAAWIAQQRGAVDLAVRHLIHARRTFSEADISAIGVLVGWHDIGLTFSYLGLHEPALAALDQVQRGELLAGNHYDIVAPEVPVRYALARDHRGDPAGCRRTLTEIIAAASTRRARGIPVFPALDWAYVAYAVKRLAAMGGERSTLDIAGYETGLGDGPEERDIVAMAGVCDALAAGDGDEALAMLDTIRVADLTFGAAEPARLRVLAHLARRDLPAAMEAQQAMHRRVCEHLSSYASLYVEGVSARIDHEHLRHAAARYAGDARTDPLTGLPNRRYLHRYLADLALHGAQAMLAMCDLDGFKAINDTHGHAVGDLVLERVAAIMASAVRRGDFVARYGGDEFVLVLPGASPSQASEIGERIGAGIEGEDWAAIAPEAKVTVSIGWSPLDAREITTGIEAADRAMYLKKHQH